MLSATGDSLSSSGLEGVVFTGTDSSGTGGSLFMHSSPPAAGDTSKVSSTASPSGGNNNNQSTKDVMSDMINE